MITSPWLQASQTASGPELGVPRPDGGDRARLGLRQPLPLVAGEDRGRRVLLHDLPERFLGQLLDGAAGPVAVAGLAEPVVGLHGRGRGPAATASAVCTHRSSGLLTTAASGHLRQPLPHRRAPGPRRLVELHARGPAGQDAAGVGRRPAVPQEQDAVVTTRRRGPCRVAASRTRARQRSPAQVGSRTPVWTSASTSTPSTTR